ncbi:MAG TPA: UDP-3-O-(3-hydroxymyristoyl)glucosamine N-acyltransferase [Candidatus Saccharimonadaceae bacterium]|jgi:UDP-3-O-[3-hydroxymyristoyl] glucosamine N-acyltransferase|nr:UDP-3-O-(3-hydroxymyristoyl)glucosamine N-acyltransferase [Candidatus Saccharimonadaceae bacterium]
MVTRTLAELAVELGGDVIGDGSTVIRGVAGIREAMPGDITFIANARYDAYLEETQASAVICSRESRAAVRPLLQVDNPYLAFQRVVKVFRPDPYRPAPGVDPSAHIAEDVTLEPGVSIGPHCVIERGAHIGARTVIMAGCYVGPLSSIGEDGYLFPRVTLREECVIGARCIVHSGVVIGADGFGFAFDDGRYHKVPQVGNVVIGDDVEIGANTTIDRATTHSTRVGDGTKIDNLVQIGHNVVIGRHCIIVAQVGISGSTELEDFVTLGGQAGLVGHIKLGTGSMVGAQSGVSKSVPAHTTVIGYPALPQGVFKRINAYIQRLPQLFQRTKQLEARMSALEGSPEREEVR